MITSAFQGVLKKLLSGLQKLADRFCSKILKVSLNRTLCRFVHWDLIMINISLKDLRTPDSWNQAKPACAQLIAVKPVCVQLIVVRISVCVQLSFVRISVCVQLSVVRISVCVQLNVVRIRFAYNWFQRNRFAYNKNRFAYNAKVIFFQNWKKSDQFWLLFQKVIRNCRVVRKRGIFREYSRNIPPKKN